MGDSFIIACGGSMIQGPPIPPFPPARDTCIQMSDDLTWSYHSTMHQGRDIHASAVNLGKLSLLGGTDAPTSMDIIQPVKTKDWTEHTIKKTKYSCAAKISPTEFMVTGGEYNPAEVLKYNAITGEVTPLANLKQERSGHGCAFVKHGNMVWVMVAGGLPMGNQHWTTDVARLSTGSTEFYNMDTGDWEDMGSFNKPRRGVKLVLFRIRCMPWEDSMARSMWPLWRSLTLQPRLGTRWRKCWQPGPLLVLWLYLRISLCSWN